MGSWPALVIDGEVPDELAFLYEGLLGMVRVEIDDNWAGIGDAPDLHAIVFQRVDPNAALERPGHVHPQQAIIDVRVGNLDVT